MKSFKEFLENKKINEGSMLDIAKKTLGNVAFTPEEESELSNLYIVVKDCVSKSPTMLQNFLARMSRGDMEMERLLNSVDVNALKRASRKDVKGVDYVENSAMDVIKSVVGTTSYSDVEEGELINLFTLVMHAVSKNPIMVKSYLERILRGEETEKLVSQINPVIIKRAAKKALSKMNNSSNIEGEEVDTNDDIN